MVQLKKLAFKQKTKLMLLIVLAFISGAAIIGQAYFFAAIVDRIFLQKQSFADVFQLLLGLFIVLLARTASHYFSGLTGIKIASKVKKDLRQSLLNKFSSNPLQVSLQGKTGQKASVLLDAVDEIDSYFSIYIPKAVQTSIIPLLILFVVFASHPFTGLIMVITAPFIPIFMIIIGYKTKKKSEEQMEKMTALSGHFLDTLQGLTTLKLFNRAKQQKEAIRKSSHGFRDATMEVLKIAFTSSFMLEFISMLSMGLIALDVAIRLIIFQNISFFTAFFMLILAPEFYNALKDLGSAFHAGRGSMGAARKIEEELNAIGKPVKWGKAVLPKGEGPPTIRIEGAGFRYEGDRFALKNINAEIRPFEQVAIVGKSGAGKSTLLHVIAGLVPLTEGEIYMNGIRRSDLNEKSWFNEISYISQNPYLFSGTIAENIALGGKLDATREEIEQAAEKAGILKLVQSLENGFDTPIGEGGRGISGGEKQRIALARAFLKKPSIILFDEPTTGLDLQTEQILQDSIKELAQSSTVITVAHRLHTIINADKILFLENGELIASGTHKELLKSVEAYRKMTTLQQGGMAK
ncbi:thiol reductant ABC exporter subunit CydD [Aeribacillus pallidus]